MRSFFFVLATFLMFLINSWIGGALFAQNLAPGQLDFSGVDKFWKVQRLLRSDISPSKETWDDLFSTPSYEYISKTMGRDKIIARFEIAYMPKYVRKRDSLLRIGDYDTRIMNHLVLVDSAVVTKYVDSLRKENFLENALKHTATYLPANFIRNNRNLYPPIVFGVFEPDGQANSKIIVLDIAFTKSIDFNKFLAHEAHHFFVGKIRKVLKEDNDPDMRYLLMAIQQLHLEGIADLLDKRDILLKRNVSEKSDWYAYHYIKYYDEAKKTLNKMDSIIQSRTNNNGKVNGRAIWNLFHFGTHPEAMHMAMVIESVFGVEHIIKILNNPFEIIWSYQKAVLRNPEMGYSFSDDTLTYFKKLEDAYLL